MRFDDLFDDLESQLESELGAVRREVADEEERFRVGKLELRHRIRRAPGSIEAGLRDGYRIRLQPLAVGRDWLSGEVLEGAPSGTGAVVPFSSIAGLRLDEQSAYEAALPADDERFRLAERLSFGYVLRDFARRRTWVRVEAPQPVGGTIDRVGRDHFDVAAHDCGTIRARGNVTHIQIVPFAAVGWIRLQP
ncbi:MAG TPA: hypothetical protein H9830_06990 [Candidatus Agrococcus pullicola]|uniref:Uncharacterized protein n=1 Tax=Candidatus Agrococcus pullicola TaxID=2838429 RepID=A0A9D2CA31_9MICO|nr:hypothetical protein [Candidatus Agrococcus pullicola]